MILPGCVGLFAFVLLVGMSCSPFVALWGSCGINIHIYIYLYIYYEKEFELFEFYYSISFLFFSGVVGV